MKIEKLRKSHKNKIIAGGLISLGVLGAITILPSFAKYRLTQSINIANGTVNYKVPDLKVMAMYTSDDGTNYTETATMPENGYVINEEKTYCTTDNVNQIKGKIKTVNGEIILKNLTKSDKCYLYFDKIKITDSASLIANSKINIGSPDFSKIATEDEGIYQASDGMYGGTSYYWRGAVTNNYVKFANFCWRIIRINGNGSIRMIYDGATCHANGTSTDGIIISNIAYGPKYQKAEYAGYTYTENQQRPSDNTTAESSNLKIQTDTWYNNNIGNNTTYNSKVEDGKFCNDREVAHGYSWNSAPSDPFYFASYERIGASNTANINPTLNCSNNDDIYTLKAGAITIDEILLAGNIWQQENQLYYLNNSQAYWTMSPYEWSGAPNGFGSVGEYIITKTGKISVGSWGGKGDTAGVRPVINIKSNVKISGTGTLKNPYEIS